MNLSHRGTGTGTGNLGAAVVDAVLGDGLAREPGLRALGWLDRARSLSQWRHRGGADAALEAEVMAVARGLKQSAGTVPAPLESGYVLLLFMPFANDEAVAGVTANPPNEAIGRALTLAANNLLRARIAVLLKAGLPARLDAFPETDHQFTALIAALRALPDQDLIGRLSLGGFADRPVGEGENRMRCQECIYYLPHRKWCDLPELPLPVEPDWYCRLWKM